MMSKYPRVYGKCLLQNFNALLSFNFGETDLKMHGTRIWECNISKTQKIFNYLNKKNTSTNIWTILFILFIKSSCFPSKSEPFLQFLLHSFPSLSCPTLIIFHPSSRFHHHLLHSFQRDKHLRKDVKLTLLQTVETLKGCTLERMSN